ncbi:MAG: hypothetical protein JKP98_25855 [Rhodobacteraceae bacterium]|nr:hypothetical protein [Paracoccaceae bacterium]
MTGLELRALPASWAPVLREWRGVYLIVDQTDGARYVGSAYGRTICWGGGARMCRATKASPPSCARATRHISLRNSRTDGARRPGEDVIARE